MSFVLDTDTCSAYLRANRVVANRFLQHTGGLYISTVTLCELETWAGRKASSPRLRITLDAMLDEVGIIPFDSDIAVECGRLRAEMFDRGAVVAIADLMIAATAIRYGFNVVTHNIRHFSVVPNLHCVDWLAPSGSQS